MTLIPFQGTHLMKWISKEMRIVWAGRGGAGLAGAGRGNVVDDPVELRATPWYSPCPMLANPGSTGIRGDALSLKCRGRRLERGVGVGVRGQGSGTVDGVGP